MYLNRLEKLFASSASVNPLPHSQRLRNMQSERQFMFSNGSGGDLKVVIPEIVDPAYGMYVWPCAPVLAQYMWFGRDTFRDKCILELGAGTALPGIVAAKCGARVHLSDNADSPMCLENARICCEMNGLYRVQVHGITWGKFHGDILNLPKLDMILASDCFYDGNHFEDILSTVTYLLEQNKGSIFVFSYQERSSSRSIEHLLHKWNLTASQITLSSFNAHSPHLAESDLPGDHTINVFKVCSKLLDTNMC